MSELTSIPIVDARNASSLVPQTPRNSSSVDDSTAGNPVSSRVPAIAIFMALGAIGVAGLTLKPVAAFFVALLMMTVSTLAVGRAVTGYWRGVLIDDRNRLSLSRLQMGLWTVVLLSGFLIGALSNIAHGKDSPLSIAVPQELWMLMGVSVTSLVGSPLILNTKRGEPKPSNTVAVEAKEVSMAKLEQQLKDQKFPGGTVAAEGKVVVWNWPSDARLSDLFRGEEITNASQVDLAKLQMFFFTAIMVFSYIVALASMFNRSPDGIQSVPPFDQGMIALLTISHAGYLTSKGIPRDGKSS